MTKKVSREKFKSFLNCKIFCGQTRKVIIFAVVSIVLINSITLVMADKPQKGRNRIIAHTNSSADRELFKLQGCKIVHELRDATALDCPDNVKIADSEPDKVLHVMDLTSDSQIKADQVWTSYTGSGVPVAVLDTGIDYTHLQLSSSSGSIDPTYGHCFAVTGNDCGNGFFDDNGHGTHVSGIITSDGLADSNNGTFSKGVAPSAKIWMAKVCDAGGDCYVSDIADAIQYIVSNHIAKVMSISSSGGANMSANCDGDYLAKQINWAYDNGVVAVIAAGNDASNGVGSPACASDAIAVAAVDSSDNLASFSNYGNALKDHGVAAPGLNIFSTLPGNTYAYWSGTSMATPHVSATIALMLQKNPNLTLAAIRSIIFSSADCLGNKYGACPNIYIGYGRADALNAVASIPSMLSLSLSASPSTITTAQSSTITASTSDIKSGVTINFSTNLGSIPSSCKTDSTGKCSVTFSSSTAGTATITGSNIGYNSSSTSVKVTQASVSSWTVLTGATPSAPALTSSGSSVYLVARGMDNGIYYRNWTSTNGWGDWTKISTGSTSDAPAAAVLNNNLYLVVRGTDGTSIWYGFVNLTSGKFSGWSSMSGAIYSAPSLTASSNKLYLVVRGLDNRIYYRTYNGSWGDWVSLPGATNNSPGAAVINNNLNIVVNGMDNAIYYGYVNLSTNGFVGWIPLSGATSSAPTLTASDKLYLVVRGLDNSIYYRSYNGSWSDWNVLTGATNNGPAATFSGGNLHLVVDGMDNNLYWTMLS